MNRVQQNDENESGVSIWKRLRKPRTKSLLRWIEFGLLVVGISLLVGVASARLDSYLSSRAALKALVNLDESGPSSQEETALNDHDVSNRETAVDPDFRNWSESRVRAYKAADSNKAGAPLGVLEIPALHLVTPLLEGTDALTLNRGVGRIAGTAKPGSDGNVGIAGHRDSFFRGLKDIKTGDVIQLKRRGGIDTYTVQKTQIVTPGDVHVLREQDAPALTLVTCYPFYFVGSAPERFVVTAFLTQQTLTGPMASVSR